MSQFIFLKRTFSQWKLILNLMVISEASVGVPPLSNLTPPDWSGGWTRDQLFENLTRSGIKLNADWANFIEIRIEGFCIFYTFIAKTKGKIYLYAVFVVTKTAEMLVRFYQYCSKRGLSYFENVFNKDCLLTESQKIHIYDVKLSIKLSIR